MEANGGLILLFAAVASALVIGSYMRWVAPEFIALQASRLGYAGRLRPFLEGLNADRTKIDRINKARKLDGRLPIAIGVVLITTNLLSASHPATTASFPIYLPALGVAVALVAVIADYMENARLGRIIDALPAMPDDAAIRLASRTTVFKLWTYLIAGVIAVVQLSVYLEYRLS